MSKTVLVVRTDMQADDTLKITVYSVISTGLEYIGYAYMRNHDVPVNLCAIDMYISVKSSTASMCSFIVERV